jgi:membrane protein
MGRRWSDRLAAVLGWGPVAAGRRVLDRFDAAGGGLLAGGLAYSALFAIVPLTVLLAGIVGIVVADDSRREGVISAIADVLPPLRDIVRLILEEAAKSAGPFSIVGAIALVWGASRFVVAFEGAIGRIFAGDRRRSFLAQNLVGFGAVLGLIGAALLGAVLAGFSSFLDAAEAQGGPVVGLLGGVLLTLVPLILAVVSLAAVYRLIPVMPPTWRAILPPAIAVAVAVAVLTRLFVFLAPRLIGLAAAVGALATAFAALVWLGLCFQAVLLGAAWARERDPEWGEVIEASTAPPSPEPLRSPGLSPASEPSPGTEAPSPGTPSETPPRI